ncbi:MAG TPA: heme-binding protein [Stellaceae bacterium]|nr:heme-binding protein [Stellaceae bacterium]
MKHLSARLAAAPWFKAAMAVLSVLCMAPGDCGGGGGGLGSETFVAADPTTEMLSTADTTSIVNQAVNAAAGLSPAVVAVVDRVGNVLAVAQMAGVATAGPNGTTCKANPCATISSGTGAVGGLENTRVPTTLAAISKAVTAAYLSSGGNAFSTRTANQIIQQHFPVGVAGNPGGPLFGVQFSQLACSDLIGSGAGTTAGPHPAPLGLAADAGGLPLYKSGVLVGGIGVMSTATYSLNTVPPPLGANTDEEIALAGQSGFAPPLPIEAPNIFVNGVSLNYLGASPTPPASPAAPVPAPSFAAVAPFYAGGGVLAAQQYGMAASGIEADANATTSFYGATPPAGFTAFPGLNAFVLVTTAGAPRFPPIDGTAPAVGHLTKFEAQALVGNALSVAAQTRAGIRIPLNTAAEVTASVIDLDGNILAVARSEDAPVFGIDVSLQKARSSVFFSRNDASSAFNTIRPLAAASSAPGGTFAYYMNGTSVGDPTVFNVGTAFSVVAIGNLARPFYPDGQDGQPPGPLSLPAGSWSVFSTGLQTDLVLPDLATFLTAGTLPATGCGAGVGLTPVAAGEKTQIANGLQIFSGGFPIYRGSTLVGALGISGDGIQQDALIAYVGIQGDGSISVAGVPTVNNAPSGIRADTVTVDGTNLVYITCPVAPFLTSREATPCS